MKKKTAKKVSSKARGKATDSCPCQARGKADGADPYESEYHQYGQSMICDTEGKGYPTPEDRNPLELVLDASDGFIPLWGPNLVLNWKFNQNSLGYFQNPNSAEKYIENLFRDALKKWGSAAPIRFKKTSSSWDFEIYMSNVDRCRGQGNNRRCTLASAFFPDGGRHRLTLYPEMFKQSKKEQVDTFLHEIGHVFGLRHFFAQVRESAFPSVVFGTHRRFSIMNYGSDSELTSDDKSDLKNLYNLVWSGRLSNIDGTPIKLMKPYHYHRMSDLAVQSYA